MGALRNPQYRPPAIPSSGNVAPLPGRRLAPAPPPTAPLSPRTPLAPVGDNVVPIPKRPGGPPPPPRQPVGRPGPYTMPTGRIGPDNTYPPYLNPIPELPAAGDALTNPGSKVRQAIDRWLDKWGVPKWQDDPRYNPKRRLPQWLYPPSPSPNPELGSLPVQYVVRTEGGQIGQSSPGFFQTIRNGPFRLAVETQTLYAWGSIAGYQEILNIVDPNGGKVAINNRYKGFVDGTPDEPPFTFEVYPVNPADQPYAPALPALPSAPIDYAPMPFPIGDPVDPPAPLRPIPGGKPVPDGEPAPSPAPLPSPVPRPAPAPSPGRSPERFPSPAPSPSPVPRPSPDQAPQPKIDPNGRPKPSPDLRPSPGLNPIPKVAKEVVEILIEKVIEKVTENNQECNCCEIEQVTVSLFDGCNIDNGYPMFRDVIVPVLEGTGPQVQRMFDELAELRARECFSAPQNVSPSVIDSGQSTHETRVFYTPIPSEIRSVVVIITGSLPASLNLYSTSASGEAQAKFGNIAQCVLSPGGGYAQDSDPGWLWTRRTFYSVPVIGLESRVVRLSLQPGLSWVLYDSGER